MTRTGATKTQPTTDLWPGLPGWFPGGDDEPEVAPPSYDPNNPDTWSGKQRADYLGSLGLDHVYGQGGSAVWQLPDGSRVAEDSAFDMVFGRYEEKTDAAGNTTTVLASPPVAIKPGKDDAGKDPARITQGGVTYERQTDGSWAPARGLPTSASGSSGGLTAYQGAELARGYAKDAEDRRQFDVTAQATAAARQAEGIRWMATQQQTIDSANANLALQQKLYDFNVTKEQYAQQIGNKTLALQAQAQMFTQQATIANLVSQRDQANANIDQFNANMQFEAQQLDVQREENRQTRLQTLNKDTAAMAADPGDRGEYASFATLNNGWGQQDAALARGANLITDESIQPIQSNLNLREILGKPLAPTVAPQTARLGALDLSALRAAGQPAPQAEGPVMTNEQQAAANRRAIEQPMLQQRANEIAWANTPKDETIPAAEHGGVMEGAYISGERGPEINIPTPNGAVVLNQKQAKKLGLDLKALMKNPDVKKMATGGIFTGSTATENTGARNFLADSLTKARAGTPWTAGPLPTPIAASTPGTSPFVAQLMASLQAQSSGLPQSEFLRLAQLYAPTAMSERVIGRSA